MTVGRRRVRQQETLIARLRAASKRLRERGILREQEFAQAKTKLIDAMEP